MSDRQCVLDRSEGSCETEACGVGLEPELAKLILRLVNRLLCTAQQGCPGLSGYQAEKLP